MNSPRDNFPAGVAKLLAARGGYICSIRGCGKHTSGPADDPDKTLNIGVAAHIRAASDGGPRYDKSQTPEARRSVANGIWCCQDHGHIVDHDHKRYTVEELLEQKAEHEKWVRDNLGKGRVGPVEVAGLFEARGRGQVTAMDVQGPAIIRPGTIARAEGEGTVTGVRIGGGS